MYLASGGHSVQQEASGQRERVERKYEAAHKVEVTTLDGRAMQVASLGPGVRGRGVLELLSSRPAAVCVLPSAVCAEVAEAKGEREEYKAVNNIQASLGRN